MFQRISSSEDCIVFMFKAVTQLSRDDSPFSSCCLDWFSPPEELQSWFKAPKQYPLNSEKEREGGYHLVCKAWLWTALLFRETWNMNYNSTHCVTLDNLHLIVCSAVQSINYKISYCISCSVIEWNSFVSFLFPFTKNCFCDIMIKAQEIQIFFTTGKTQIYTSNPLSMNWKYLLIQCC